MSNSVEDAVFEVKEIKNSVYKDLDKDELKGLPKCKNATKEFLKHKYKIVIFCLIAIIVAEFLLINNKNKLLRLIFLTKENEFQWLAITSILAIATFLFTSINTVKKNKADLVAKSRIEWIQEVKQIMAIYLKDVTYYPFLFKKYAKNNTSDSKRLELETELNELALRIKQNKNLLLLHLSNNEDNKQLNECIQDCEKWIKNMRVRWRIQTKGNTNVDLFEYKLTPIDNLLIVSREYFKREWDKSKKGK